MRIDKERRERIVTVLGLIAQDAEDDAYALEGRPFDGRTVASQFGNLLASVKTLAEIMKVIIENERYGNE